MIATAARKPLGQLLLDKGLIKPEQLERALDMPELQHFSRCNQRGGVPLKPGAAELLALLDEVGLPKALVTSSSRRALTELRRELGQTK